MLHYNHSQQTSRVTHTSYLSSSYSYIVTHTSYLSSSYSYIITHTSYLSSFPLHRGTIHAPDKFIIGTVNIVTNHYIALQCAESDLSLIVHDPQSVAGHVQHASDRAPPRGLRRKKLVKHGFILSEAVDALPNKLNLHLQSIHSPLGVSICRILRRTTVKKYTMLLVFSLANCCVERKRIILEAVEELPLEPNLHL